MCLEKSENLNVYTLIVLCYTQPGLKTSLLDMKFTLARGGCLSWRLPVPNVLSRRGDMFLLLSVARCWSSELLLCINTGICCCPASRGSAASNFPSLTACGSKIEEFRFCEWWVWWKLASEIAVSGISGSSEVRCKLLRYCPRILSGSRLCPLDGTGGFGALLHRGFGALLHRHLSGSSNAFEQKVFIVVLCHVPWEPRVERRIDSPMLLWRYSPVHWCFSWLLVWASHRPHAFQESHMADAGRSSPFARIDIAKTVFASEPNCPHGLKQDLRASVLAEGLSVFCNLLLISPHFLFSFSVSLQVPSSSVPRSLLCQTWDPSE